MGWCAVSYAVSGSCAAVAVVLQWQLCCAATLSHIAQTRISSIPLKPAAAAAAVAPAAECPSGCAASEGIAALSPEAPSNQRSSSTISQASVSHRYHPHISRPFTQLFSLLDLRIQVVWLDWSIQSASKYVTSLPDALGAPHRHWHLLRSWTRASTLPLQPIQTDRILHLRIPQQRRMR